MNHPNLFAPRRTSHKKTTPRTKLLKYVKRGLRRSTKREYKNEYIQTLAEFVDATSLIIIAAMFAKMYEKEIFGKRNTND